MGAADSEVNAYPEMWAALDMDMARFDKARQMLGEVYGKSSSPSPNGRRACLF